MNDVIVNESDERCVENFWDDSRKKKSFNFFDKTTKKNM